MLSIEARLSREETIFALSLLAKTDVRPADILRATHDFKRRLNGFSPLLCMSPWSSPDVNAQTRICVVIWFATVIG